MHGAGEIRGNLLAQPGEMRAWLPANDPGIGRQLAGQ